MNEEELLKLCSGEDIYSFRGVAPYWASEIYGFGKHIREYAFFPNHWPLILFTEHSGPVLMKKFNYFETNHDAPTVMLHSPARVKEWKSIFQKPCYNLYSPFVFYRKKNHLRQLSDAKGTLAYVAHTIPELDIESSMEEYIHQLKSLPDKYQPVSVCLHYHDINKGLYKLFFRHGIPVYTAGTPFDYRFTERFYSLLTRFKYTTSNSLGSYVFYSVEIKIPFFLYGNPPIYKSNSNSRLANEAFDVANTKDDFSRHLTHMFSTISDCVTPEQTELVELTLGLHHGISRLKMAKILYWNCLNYYMNKTLKSFALHPLFTGSGVNWLMRRIRRFSKF